MRSGKGIQYEGYDGNFGAGRGTVFISNNLSAWNMGVNQKPKGKANSDYIQRTNDLLAINQS